MTRKDSARKGLARKGLAQMSGYVRRILIYLNAARTFAGQHFKMWHPITTAPADRDIELAVLDREGQHALVFPCRRIAAGWMNAHSGERLDVHPTHWRVWADGGGT